MGANRQGTRRRQGPFSVATLPSVDKQLEQLRHLERVMASYLHRNVLDDPLDELVDHYVEIAEEQRRERKEFERKNKGR